MATRERYVCTACGTMGETMTFDNPADAFAHRELAIATEAAR